MQDEKKRSNGQEFQGMSDEDLRILRKDADAELARREDKHEEKPALAGKETR